METFKVILFALALLTSLACTVFLYRGYLQTRVRILLWSALCFVGLTVNNLVLIFDLVLLPDADLRIVRLTASLTGMLFLLYGFIRESD